MESSENQQYIVVARRYRPKSFVDLVGQQHISQALENAINTNRVGHAYLFTGARGVGKTSTARILAKCLNCNDGPSAQPCGTCDACQSIASGEDVDVLEIDGASNRGIDEIRQLRSNVNIRPSRSRYKVYIIDEVHMLTTPAFNALLKTLEEPPEHVKFIFCTTDPEKIPITVVSRCQRFDFAPVQTESIVERLKHIVASEGVEADDDALQMLARRAGGSMRDSQSLLEQLLAFCSEKVTSDDVHQMLGTARSGQLSSFVERLIQRDAAGSLVQVDSLIQEGADAGQVTEQLLGWFRDMMAATVGCDSELMLHSGPSDFESVTEAGSQMGLETILAVTQILDETLVRMRQSTHARTLLEMAVVRICKLEDLDQISTLVAELKSGRSTPISPAKSPKRTVAAVPAEPTASPQKKSEKNEGPAVQTLKSEESDLPLTTEMVQEGWKQALEQIGDMTAEFAGFYDSLAISAPNQLVVSFRAEYTHQKETCERPERKESLEQALSRILGRRVRIDFNVLPGEAKKAERQPVLTKRQRMRELEKHPLVREAIEIFDAEITDLKSKK